VLEAESTVNPFWRASNVTNDTLILNPLFSNSNGTRLKRLDFVSNRQLLYKR